MVTDQATRVILSCCTTSISKSSEVENDTFAILSRTIKHGYKMRYHGVIISLHGGQRDKALSSRPLVVLWDLAAARLQRQGPHHHHNITILLLLRKTQRYFDPLKKGIRNIIDMVHDLNVLPPVSTIAECPH
jgi:hypothetical protein